MKSAARTFEVTATRSGLAVGELVVYAGHGVGRISVREKRGEPGARTEVVVLAFADGLSVTLPIERAREYLRPISGKAEVERVQKTLRVTQKPSGEPWQKRFRTTQAKVAVGEALGLAEVVGDGARRDNGPVDRGGPGRLSASERDLYVKARRLLATEIGISRGTDTAEADAWIAGQLAHNLGAVQA
jgi:RNA polymerase-interacting CarD/CdnL/TRCF family regulator